MGFSVENCGRRFPLSGENGRGLYLLLDCADYERVVKMRRSVFLSGVRGCMYARVKANGKSLAIHRLIMRAEEAQAIDHANGNTLDCRKQNLRFSNQAENTRNCKPRGGRQFKGVRRQNNRWRAQICADYQKIHLGYFDAQEDAARAYDVAAVKYHGEFARLNFPRTGGTNES